MVGLGSSVEVKGFFVSLDRIAPCFPARQSTFEEFDSQEMHGLSSMQDQSAGFIIWTCTVNNGILLFRDERWIRKQVFRGNPGGAEDDLRIS
jgi:hypothetical protein